MLKYNSLYFRGPFSKARNNNRITLTEVMLGMLQAAHPGFLLVFHFFLEVLHKTWLQTLAMTWLKLDGAHELSVKEAILNTSKICISIKDTKQYYFIFSRHTYHYKITYIFQHLNKLPLKQQATN